MLASTRVDAYRHRRAFQRFYHGRDGSLNNRRLSVSLRARNVVLHRDVHGVFKLRSRKSMENRTGGLDWSRTYLVGEVDLVEGR